MLWARVLGWANDEQALPKEIATIFLLTAPSLPFPTVNILSLEKLTEAKQCVVSEHLGASERTGQASLLSLGRWLFVRCWLAGRIHDLRKFEQPCWLKKREHSQPLSSSFFRKP